MALAPFYWGLLLVTWTYCLAFGGRDALWAFCFFIAATTGTWYASEHMHQFQRFNGLLFASDTLYFLGLFAIALNSRHYWPIWSAGLQFCCVLTHFGPLLDPETNANLYLGLESVWALPILGTMIVGISKDKRIGKRGPINENLSLD